MVIHGLNIDNTSRIVKAKGLTLITSEKTEFAMSMTFSEDMHVHIAVLSIFLKICSLKKQS
jgi:hypothetical protein